MSKKRIYEIARELGVSSKELIDKLDELGMPGLKAANSVDDEESALIVHLYEEDQTGAEPSTAKATPSSEAP
ncbi:translation initiation factor IF-2 N-terminal domain-containing protein, partial [Candidatus Bipolaricaulota bacterium]|nr:translation initiation factor IF-2 N-terminal domain-containing protein [Candidatus Bipolaricaulota bacterium]